MQKMNVNIFLAQANNGAEKSLLTQCRKYYKKGESKYTKEEEGMTKGWFMKHTQSVAFQNAQVDGEEGGVCSKGISLHISL